MEDPRSITITPRQGTFSAVNTQAGAADGPADFGDHRGEAVLVVPDDGRLSDNVAILIFQYPFGTSPGTVDGDETEMLRADLLDSRMERAARLGDGQIPTRTDTSR